MPFIDHFGGIYALCATILCAAGVAWLIHGLINRSNVSASATVWYQQKRSSKKTQARQQGIEDLLQTFPPLQRDRLADSLPALSDTKTDQPKSPQLLAMSADYRLADPSLHVFSGLTVSEIKSLGSFPDYAKLSGVPLPTAVRRGFSVDTALPRPYRPFRWPYFQTMGKFARLFFNLLRFWILCEISAWANKKLIEALQKMDPDYWIELESTYRERIVQRRALFAAHGKDILHSLPGSELACQELMEMAVQFLCARYPHLFERRAMTLFNHVLGTSCDLAAAEEPLGVILDNVPEDFAIMLRDEETGRYCLRAGVVCSTIGWTLSDKMGLGVAEIHQPVPDYEEKLELSVDRYIACMLRFSTMDTDRLTGLLGAGSFQKCRHLLPFSVRPGA